MSTALRELLAFFSVDVDDGKLRKAHGKIEETKSATEALGGAFEKLKIIAEGALAGLGIERLVESTEALSNEAVALKNTADAAGISVSALDTWQDIAEATGQDGNALAFTFKTLAKNAYDASNGSAEFARAFKELGVNVKGSDGSLRPASELIDDVTTALARIDNPTQRAALATETLGRGALTLLPALSRGEKGLEELRGTIEAAGDTFTSSFIAQAEESKLVTFAWEKSIKQAKVALASLLLPVLDAFERRLTPIVRAIRDFVSAQGNANTLLKALAITTLPLLIARLGGLGGILRGIRVLAVEAFLPFAATAGAILLIEDFIGFLEGKDSVIGAFFNKLAGPGGAARIRKYLLDKLDELKQKFEDVKAAGARLWESFKGWLNEHIGLISSVLALYGLTKVAIYAVTTAQAIWRGAVVLFNGAMIVARGVIAGYNAVTALMATETYAAAVASGTLEVSLLPLLGTVLAIGAAVAAVTVAWRQMTKLANETGGLGFTGIVQQMWKQGTLNPFTAVDQFQNAQARAEARLPASGSSSTKTLNDQRSTVINISGASTPGATARAVDQTMQRAQAHDRQAIREAF